MDRGPQPEQDLCPVPVVPCAAPQGLLSQEGKKRLLGPTGQHSSLVAWLREPPARCGSAVSLLGLPQRAGAQR